MTLRVAQNLVREGRVAGIVIARCEPRDRNQSVRVPTDLSSDVERLIETPIRFALVAVFEMGHGKARSDSYQDSTLATSTLSV